MTAHQERPKRRLHVGCGVELIPGFVNMDADASIPGLDVTGGVEDLSQFAEDEFDEIYLSHVLEHVPYARVPGVLAGLHRILRRGGTIRISVPDLDRICRLYVEHIDWFAPPHNPWLGILYGGQVNDFDFHKSGFNFRYLDGLLRAAGFASVTAVPPTEEFGVRDGSFSNRPFGPVSLNVTATKGPADVREAPFRHTALEKALVLAERALEIGLRVTVEDTPGAHQAPPRTRSDRLAAADPLAARHRRRPATVVSCRRIEAGMPGRLRVIARPAEGEARCPRNRSAPEAESTSGRW